MSSDQDRAAPSRFCGNSWHVTTGSDPRLPACPSCGQEVSDAERAKVLADIARRLDTQLEREANAATDDAVIRAGMDWHVR